MATGKNLLPPLKKREVLFSAEVSGEEKAEWGRRYLAAGRVMDALDFFTEAKSRDDLEGMRRLAVDEGDAFILRMIERAVPELVNEAHWKGLAKNARSRSKVTFGEQAERGGEVELPVVDAIIQDDPTAQKENGEGLTPEETTQEEQSA